MEDAAEAELRVSDPLDRFSPVDLQGRDFAEGLHHAEFPGLVRFLLNADLWVDRRAHHPCPSPPHQSWAGAQQDTSAQPAADKRTCDEASNA
ncbi:hypothetical protein [Streptomyces anulatus]|uniref:hypothetical protein n=1 Tax=Streptomyces anulatus TaxID=1892 RepID=UPI00331F8C9E